MAAGRVIKQDESMGKPPADVKEVAARMRAAEKQDQGDTLTSEERRALGEDPEADELDEDGQLLHTMATAESVENDGPPEWAVLPEKFVLPKNGKQIHFMLIKAEWTDNPGGPDHHCIAWNLTVADEDMALKRCRGDQLRVTRESCMQFIRAIDGHRVDWTNSKLNGQGNVKKWMDAIGPRGRMLVQNVYIRTHSVDGEVALRFFADCYTSMSST